MLELQRLTKRYGARTAVSDFSLSLKRGERLGLLGPNGAGKTTVISILVGALRADSGTVLLDNKPLTGDTNPLKRRLGYVPQEIALYEDLSAADNLRLFGALYGLKGPALERRIADELETVGLADRAKGPVRAFSGGMKRRLNIAAALLHEPELLILDEPTVGVDPQSRNAIFDKIEQLAAAGVTLLYTTHYMEEVERLCRRIAIMDGGKLLAEGTQAELRALLPSRASRLRVEVAPSSIECVNDDALAALRALPGVTEATAEGGLLTVSLDDIGARTLTVLRTLGERGIAYASLASERPNLEEVFLHLTGRSLRDV
jgi:ABC-type multidrug transport system, ATPase component